MTSQSSPLGALRVILAALGDVNSPVTWSGIPYYLLQAGRNVNFIHEGLDLSVSTWPWGGRRVAWNAVQMGLRLDRPGGYQYSAEFLERLWAPVRAAIRGSILINCYQLFAPSVVEDMSIEKWFYIDMTLQQLFNEYDLKRSIGDRILQKALAREAIGYRAAAGVICHSVWAARSVIENYGVAPAKVHVVVPGASLDMDAYAVWQRTTDAARQTSIGDGPVRLVSVGKDWRRKGLDLLLRAYVIARRKGASLSLRVIGCDPLRLPKELRSTPEVEWVGFVDKRTDSARFQRLVADCDVGCHLSRAEAGGIAQREFHALGLAVLGTDVGGAREHRYADASLDVSTAATPETIAGLICELVRDRDRLLDMKRAAWARRKSALWPSSVEQLRVIIAARNS